MSEASVLTQLRSFDTQTTPTIEETIQNNRIVLYKRKKHFLQDLKDTINFLGIIVIAMIYLRDISMLRLLLRGYNQMTLSNPFPPHSEAIPLTDQNKRALTKFLLLGILLSNGYCFISHLLFGVINSRYTSNGYIYCGLTLQFIGEKVPNSRLQLLLLDLLITGLQLIYHSLMCLVDNSEVLRNSPVETEIEEGDSTKSVELDGYQGNIHLLSINLYENLKTVLSYQETLQYPSFQRTNENHTMLPTPGSFV